MTTQYNIPEYFNLQQHHCDDLISCKVFCGLFHIGKYSNVKCYCGLCLREFPAQVVQRRGKGRGFRGISKILLWTCGTRKVEKPWCRVWLWPFVSL